MSQYGDLIARNLKRFRRERNLTQKKLADKTGVSLPCIKKVEGNHIDAPSTATLTKLAAGLGRTIFDFYREPQTLQAVRFRANASFGATARETIVDSCAVWLDRYCFLEDLLDDKLEFNLPAPTMTGSKLDVREYSAEIRSRLGFTPSEPIANVSDALVRSGAKFWFCRRPAPEDVFGLAFAESPQRTGVVVFDTDAINAERRIFSAIHELGHLALHQKSFDSQIADENPDEESQADLFASHSLCRTTSSYVGGRIRSGARSSTGSCSSRDISGSAIRRFFGDWSKSSVKRRGYTLNSTRYITAAIRTD